MIVKNKLKKLDQVRSEKGKEGEGVEECSDYITRLYKYLDNIKFFMMYFNFIYIYIYICAPIQIFFFFFSFLYQ